ncbi:hypothetical protein Tco_0287151 [Tanacetum coccineum]
MNPLSESSCSCSDNSSYGGAIDTVAPRLRVRHWNQVDLEFYWSSRRKTWQVLREKHFRKISDDCNVCVASTPAIVGKVPYLVALVALLGARTIVVKMTLGQGSPIQLLFACPHIVDLGDILPLGRLLLVTMVELSFDALNVLTTRPTCYSSLALCLSSLRESLPSVPDAYGRSLEALPSQPAASGNQSNIPGAVSE